MLAFGFFKERVFEIFEGDLNTDGEKEQVYKVQNYRAFTLHIKNSRHHIEVPLNYTEYVYVKDIDKDGVYEIISYDNCYIALFGLCLACSPAIKFVTHYENGKLILQPNFIKAPTYSLHKIPLILDSYGSLRIDETDGDIYTHAQVLETILTYFYKGKAYIAVTLIKKYIPFQSRSMKVLFLQDIVNAMSRSYFWNQIKQLNNWQKYQKFEIVSELFEELDKQP